MINNMAQFQVVNIGNNSNSKPNQTLTMLSCYYVFITMLGFGLGFWLGLRLGLELFQPETLKLE